MSDGCVMVVTVPSYSVSLFCPRRRVPTLTGKLTLHLHLDRSRSMFYACGESIQLRYGLLRSMGHKYSKIVQHDLLFPHTVLVKKYLHYSALNLTSKNWGFNEIDCISIKCISIFIYRSSPRPFTKQRNNFCYIYQCY